MSLLNQVITQWEYAALPQLIPKANTVQVLSHTKIMFFIFIYLFFCDKKQLKVTAREVYVCQQNHLRKICL